MIQYLRKAAEQGHYNRQVLIAIIKTDIFAEDEVIVCNKEDDWWKPGVCIVPALIVFCSEFVAALPIIFNLIQHWSVLAGWYYPFSLPGSPEYWPTLSAFSSYRWSRNWTANQLINAGPTISVLRKPLLSFISELKKKDPWFKPGVLVEKTPYFY